MGERAGEEVEGETEIKDKTYTVTFNSKGTEPSANLAYTPDLEYHHLTASKI